MRMKCLFGIPTGADMACENVCRALSANLLLSVRLQIFAAAMSENLALLP